MKEDRKKNHEWRKRSQFIAFLALAALVVLLAGCGDETSGEEGSAQSSEPDQSEQDNQAADEEKPEDYEEVDTSASDLEGITEDVSVTEVIDGDTIIVEGENGEETVRLALVDAPSKTFPDGTSDDEYGFESNDYTTVRLEGANVLLERAENQDDAEGRTLGYIWFRNGQNHVNFNELMLKDGIARLATESTSNEKYLDELKKAEAEAKAEQKLIWSVDGYVMDDGFNASLVQ